MEEIKKVLENEADVLFAYLFGSYARGTQGKTSDIDIAIYLRDVDILDA
ncbi:MAG: nucleotidyltransferase domain-containing protein [Candidatus Methanoperedens sp.]|nr:nucleotidyltransferase domain-containing protein [Candidatus Methanoperedens sp.]